MEWDLFRTFEVVARLGSLTAAAQALGVSQSTVSRHLMRLEKKAGSPLLLRETPICLTQRGEALLSSIQPMVNASLVAESVLEEEVELRGEVTITTTGELIRWVLADHFASFFAVYPSLQLRILADNRVNSLAAGEADIALRFQQPTRGELIAKRIYTERYGCFLSKELTFQPDVPWLGLAGSLSQLREQMWAAQIFEGRTPRLLLEDFESLGKAVEAGLGIALLPLGVARELKGVVHIPFEAFGIEDEEAIPTKKLWMVVHRSKQRLPKVRAVMEWLSEIFAALSLARAKVEHDIDETKTL